MSKKERYDASTRRLAIGVAALLMSMSGCGVEELEMPPLYGPDTVGLSLILTATPDVVMADGKSTSSIGVLLRGPNGQGVAGRQIVLAVGDPTQHFSEVGIVRPEHVTTDSEGRASAIYTAPVRTDHAGDGYVYVMGRPLGTDFSGAIYHSVMIEVRSAEPGRFPGGACSGALYCNFVIEPPTGPWYTNIWYSMQSTSCGGTGIIIRYEWNFGDGTTEVKPDVLHAYRSPGSYSIIHVVTDSSGAQAECSQSIEIQ
jgi:hypothetical protein